jgi:hypothetical protein
MIQPLISSGNIAIFVVLIQIGLKFGLLGYDLGVHTGSGQ